eukprot:5368179-Amphidinium_carterae.1
MPPGSHDHAKGLQPTKWWLCKQRQTHQVQLEVMLCQNNGCAKNAKNECLQHEDLPSNEQNRDA